MLIFNVAFFVVLLSTVLQGTTIEPVARLARRDLRRGGDPGAARGAGAAEPARRRGGAVPGPRERRGGRPPGARARAAARDAAERDRARRPGDPAARLDDRRGGRPAARDRAPGGRGRVPGRDAAVAHRARWRRTSARGRGCSAARRSPRCARGRRPTATPRDRGGGRRGRRRSAAHAPRRAGRAGRARRRALRGDRPAARGRAGRRAPGRGAAPARPRDVARRARLVAGGRRRARALEVSSSPLCDGRSHGARRGCTRPASRTSSAGACSPCWGSSGDAGRWRAPTGRRRSGAGSRARGG